MRLLGVSWTTLGAVKLAHPAGPWISFVLGAVECTLGAWLLVGKSDRGGIVSCVLSGGLVVWNLIPATVRPLASSECGCLGAFNVSEAQRLFLASLLFLLSVLAWKPGTREGAPLWREPVGSADT